MVSLEKILATPRPMGDKNGPVNISVLSIQHIGDILGKSLGRLAS